jgi:MFS family permease
LVIHSFFLIPSFFLFFFLSFNHSSIHAINQSVQSINHSFIHSSVNIHAVNPLSFNEATFILQQHRGFALGFMNLGIYLGYGLTFVLMWAEKMVGWRAVYFISGAPGILLAALVLVTVREADRGAMDDTAKVRGGRREMG